MVERQEDAPQMLPLEPCRQNYPCCAPLAGLAQVPCVSGVCPALWSSPACSLVTCTPQV